MDQQRLKLLILILLHTTPKSNFFPQPSFRHLYGYTSKDSFSVFDLEFKLSRFHYNPHIFTLITGSTTLRIETYKNKNSPSSDYHYLSNPISFITHQNIPLRTKFYKNGITTYTKNNFTQYHKNRFCHDKVETHHYFQKIYTSLKKSHNTFPSNIQPKPSLSLNQITC